MNARLFIGGKSREGAAGGEVADGKIGGDAGEKDSKSNIYRAGIR